MDFDAMIKKADEMRQSGKYDDAIKLYEEALRLAQNERERGEAEYGLARSYQRKGELYEAQTHIREAIKHAENAGDADLLTRVYTVAMDIHISLGDLPTAEKFYKLGMKYVNNASKASMFNFYNLLAIFYFDRGKIGLAESYWEKCLSIAKELDDPKLFSIAHNNLGEVHRIKGEYGKAVKSYEMAYENSKKIEDYRSMAINLLNMGYVERENGNLEMAEKYLRESVELYRKHNDDKIASSSYSTLAIVLADLENFDEARKIGEKGLELAEKTSDKATIGEALLYLGYVHEKMGDLRNAIRIYNKARQKFIEIDNKVMLSETELAIGRALLSGEKKDAAKFHLEEARKIAEKIGEFKVLQKANYLLSKC